MKKNEFIIATYNIQFATIAEKIIANIIAMANDGVEIFCLQEIVHIQNEVFIIDRILKQLGNDWRAAYHVGKENSKLSIGTAILWNIKKLKLKKIEKISLPKLKRFDLHEKLYYKVIGVLGVPLQRRATTCYFIINKIEFRVTCIHIDNVGGPKHRLKQISYLLSELNKKATPGHEIICGDFNTFDLLKTRYEKKLLQRKLGKEFSDASKYVGWTSDIHQIDFTTSIRFFPWLIKTFNVHIRRKLDYIWIKQIEVILCKKLSMPGSDHLPIIAKCRLKDIKTI
ncbi:MAG TPA: endonuclease/exonuclease/phosphatase family protein [Candidatus Sulfotelmatobacter sp.]|jgi:endonuclease/exonuclease/phosphatase family metal-dependent hydrolase|nr:endonuclease/exonuclease/phosphatase family protein [Candidatus Sulfotelmatobacter sp.]